MAEMLGALFSCVFRAHGEAIFKNPVYKNKTKLFFGISKEKQKEREIVNYHAHAVKSKT